MQDIQWIQGEGNVKMCLESHTSRRDHEGGHGLVQLDDLQ